MSSSNNSGRPSGSISIPVEIIRDSNSSNNTNSHSRHNSPYRTFQNDNSFGGFSNSPPWPSSGRFQPRQSPGPAYDRVISNSQFNQPFTDRPSFQTYQEPQVRHPSQQMYEPGPSNFSRSSEDLLNQPFDSLRYSNQPTYSSLIPPTFTSPFRNDSDFVHPTKYSSPLRRSFDALNDFGDMQQNFPTNRPYQTDYQQQQPYYRTTYQTQYQPQQQQQQQPSYTNQNYTNPNIVYTDEFGTPTDRYQTNNLQGTGSNISNDRSRSPTSQRGPSPARNTPPNSQQQEEPELKMAKDAGGPIPMPPPASASSSPPNQSTDQQVPSNDNSTSTSAPSPPPAAAEPARDPDTTALEKLDKMKAGLDVLEKQVDEFTGSTRNDRLYKGLDEQLLKIMIRCDELVDVSADIKEKRKEMIRNVQKVINKLESKVPPTPAAENNSNPMETTAMSNMKSTDNTNNSMDDEMIERKASQSENNSSTQTTTEQTVLA